jgi:hypothetical protein
MPNQWNTNELDLISATDELAVAPRRADGSQPTYTTIWVVRVGDDLYVRSYRGPAGRWYRAARRSKEGRIRAGSLERDVDFEPSAESAEPTVDDAYRAKYGRSSYVEAMTSAEAVSTTLRLVPR